jgi:hypothetical protein
MLYAKFRTSKQQGLVLFHVYPHEWNGALVAPPRLLALPRNRRPILIDPNKGRVDFETILCKVFAPRRP